MRSLTLKLVLAFLFVGLVGVALVALYVGVRMRSEFNRFVLDRDQSTLAAALTQYYQVNNTWEGAEAAFRYYYMGGMMRNPRWAVAMLVDADGRVILGAPGMLNRRISQAEFNVGVPLRVNNQVVGWLLFDSMAVRERETTEQLFLTRVTQAILFSALGAMGVALLLGILLTRTLTHPIHELIAATQAIASGQLGHQVSVRSKDELGRLAASFNRMSRDLARATELRRQMTADIAHELRTPLSLISGYTEALSEGKLVGSSEIFEIMHSEARRLNRLVEELRTLSLADASELPLMRQPIVPQVLLEHIALVYMPQAEARHISLQVQAAPDLSEIEVDRDRMLQVLGNLMSNALRYTPPGGQITLTAEQSGPQVILSVRDTGAGIAPEDLPHVFDRFYRGDKSRSRQEGESGLGLAIAKSLVEMHGGTITVESAVGAGAIFTITLPAVETSVGGQEQR